MNKLKVIISVLMLSACGCVGVMAQKCEPFSRECACDWSTGYDASDHYSPTNLKCDRVGRYLNLSYDAIQLVKQYASYDRCLEVDEKLGRCAKNAAELVDNDDVRIEFEDWATADVKVAYKLVMAVTKLSFAKGKLNASVKSDAATQKASVERYMQAVEQISKVCDLALRSCNRAAEQATVREATTPSCK